MCDVFCSACFERNSYAMDILEFNFRYGTQSVRCQMNATDLLQKTVVEVNYQQILETAEPAPL